MKRKRNKEYNIGNSFINDSFSFSKLPNTNNQHDWQNLYNESEQTFSSFKRTSPIIYPNHNDVFYIICFIDKNNSRHFDFRVLIELIRKYCMIFYNVSSSKVNNVCFVKNLYIEEKKNKLYINKHQLEWRIALDHEEKQIKVDSFLSFLKENVDGLNRSYNLIGLTMYDLYDIETTLFVSGMANQNTGIFSFARYDPYYLFKKMNCEYDSPLPLRLNRINHKHRKRVILQKGLKTITHEILHNCGLGHCVKWKCLMNGSANLKEDENAPYFLCFICLKKLWYFSKIHPLERYEKMKDFFDEIKNDESVRWLEKRINFLKTNVIVIDDDDDDDDDVKIIHKSKRRKIK